jgi:hypothetical protein
MIQHKTIRVVEQAGVGASSFPVSFELDTARLIREGKMRPDGTDIRIAIAGVEVPYQVEGMNTEHTIITFQIDLKPNESRDDIALQFGIGLEPATTYDRSWGTIHPTMDGFENGLLRISYGAKTGTYGKKWGCQSEFTIKSASEDQFGGEAAPQSWAKSRNDVTYWKENVPARFQEIEVDGPIYKRVRFFTDEVISDDHGRLENLSQRVTFYRNCPFIKEEYENIKGAVVDVMTPGGMPLRTHGKRNFDFVAFNFDSRLITWNGIGDDHGTRGGWDASRARAERDPRYRYLDDYVYNDHFMMGVSNTHNGRGLASCVLAGNIRTCYFVDWPHERGGYSFWPRKGGKMIRHFYYVEAGEEEALSRGKLLANPPQATIVE